MTKRNKEGILRIKYTAFIFMTCFKVPRTAYKAQQSR